MLTGSAQARPADRATIVFDFDGTVALGDGPVLAYAEAAFALLDPARAATARTTIARVLAGQDHRWPDPYVAVASLCAEVDPAELQIAYLRSREDLARDGLGVTAPDGLAAALDRWQPHAERVLVTNSPARGTVEALERLDLATRFDQVVVGAGKPDGLPTILQTLLDGRPAHHLVSIGDHWPNDLRPALELGCIALAVSADSEPAPAHAHATSVTDLLPVIDTWLADPDGFAADHDLLGRGVS